MKLPPSKSVTLLELLIAIVLMSLVVLGFSSIDLFSRYHVITSDKRAKVQNEVSYVLEHMTKQISKAIGNEKIDGIGTVIKTTTRIGSDIVIDAYIDYNQNGKRSSGDRVIAYRFTGSTGSRDDRYQIRYCPQCQFFPCTSCYSNWDENILSKKITAFTPTKPVDANNYLRDNYVDIELTACYDPDGSPYACGTSDNPTVEMQSRIKMPSVSTN